MYPQFSPIIPIHRPDPIDDPGWAAELKLDGFRGLADTFHGRMLSKNLYPLNRFYHLTTRLPPGSVFDGEICALDRDGRPDFNALLFGHGEPVYIVFDLLFYRHKDLRKLPLKERRAILDEVAKRYRVQKSELFFGCSKKLYETVCAMNLEGIVLKPISSEYSNKTTWIKVLNRKYTGKEGRHELFERRGVRRT